MGFTLDMALVMAVSAAALVLFVTERLTPDLVSLLAVLAVMLLGLSGPDTALAGFSNPAVLTIAAMFVISAGLIQTGVVERFTERLIALGGESKFRVFFFTLATVVILSAFINNTPIVVMMIPVALGIGHVHDVAPSKLLIPISYASIFGGICTLLGTSTNLVVSGMAVREGLAPLSMFEMTRIGLVLAAAGLAYLAVFGRRILPHRETVTSSVSDGRIREYLTELVLRPGCTLAGTRLAETSLETKGLRVLEVIRGDEILWPPFDEILLEENDILLVKGSVDEIVEAARRSGVDVIPELGPEGVRIDAVSQTLAEMVISPGSRFEGATIQEIGFRQHFGISIVAIQRHGRHHVREKIGSMRLRTGDMLLVQGEATAVDQLRNEEGAILLEGLEDAVRNRGRAPFAVAILLAVIAAATFTRIPVVASAMAGAVLMVLTGCLSTRQLYRSLDVRTLVLIAGMIGLGLTAEETGATVWVADRLIDVVRPLGPYGVLAMIYLLTNLVTEFLSNAAAAVLMLPLALSTAREFDVSGRPFMIVVAVAASAAFSTPIGYQTNTIVYGPGGYRFTDYARVGLPLNLIFLAITVLLVPVFWPFHPPV